MGEDRLDRVYVAVSVVGAGGVGGARVCAAGVDVNGGDIGTDID